MSINEHELEQKLETLATEIEGFDSIEEMINAVGFDSVMPGICSDPNCDGSTNVEPDTREGWCPICNGNTIWSAMEIYLSTGA